MKEIVFICGAKDIHAVDKFRVTMEAVRPRRVLLLTDTLEGEGEHCLLRSDDNVSHLLLIDKFTLNKKSSYSNILRNIVKLLVIPVQVYYLRKFYRKHDDYIFHAIPMYYMLLCYLARIPFLGTPQGSEILVRPERSWFYKKTAIKVLKAARYVIVDSVNMQRKVNELAKVNALIFKNGFDTKKALASAIPLKVRTRVLSMRGINPIYRTHKIVEERNRISDHPITFVYPSCEEDYKRAVEKYLLPNDEDLGRLERDELYTIMKETLLAISIPSSDSSPRSVYECIFSGACVAVTYSPYIDELPHCMKNRIYVIDLSEKDWFINALEHAKEIVEIPYIPSEEALNMCDQYRTINKLVEKIY